MEADVGANAEGGDDAGQERLQPAQRAGDVVDLCVGGGGSVSAGGGGGGSVGGRRRGRLHAGLGFHGHVHGCGSWGVDAMEGRKEGFHRTG